MPALLLAITLLVSIATLATTPAPAEAAVGVERVSRHAGMPGEEVKLTLGCGFCFPPCKGEPGQRNGPCMPGYEPAPESFAISLVPIEKAPAPHRCGPRALCSPHTLGPPGRAPYSFLGEATPPAAGTEQPGARHVPRYTLDFEIPERRAGVYTFVIFCDVCMDGKAGSLIASPGSRNWRLRVRP